MKSLCVIKVALAALVAVSGCLAAHLDDEPKPIVLPDEAPEAPDHVEEYRLVKESLDANMVNDLEVLLFYLSTWRMVRSQLHELKEGTAELVNRKPVTTDDAPVLLDELKVRARELQVPLDETNRDSIRAMLQELVVKPCQVYRNALDKPLFKQVELEDPRLESYYADDSKMDFYTGWATLKMCVNLVEEIERGSLVDNMLKLTRPDYNSI